MATFRGLFDFLDLSDGQSELPSPLDSSDDEYFNELTEDKEDAWYNLPSDSDDSDDLDNNLTIPTLVLPIPALSTALIVSTIGPKEHSTDARIKAIYMLKEKKSLVQIRDVTKVPKTVVYRLAAVRERGW
jgi:hypothetical protein